MIFEIVELNRAFSGDDAFVDLAITKVILSFQQKKCEQAKYKYTKIY